MRSAIISLPSEILLSKMARSWLDHQRDGWLPPFGQRDASCNVSPDALGPIGVLMYVWTIGTSRSVMHQLRYGNLILILM